MLPRRPVEVLCFRRTEIPGKEGAKAIRCREFRSKAYACQESESALVEGSVVLPQVPGLGVCRRNALGRNMAPQRRFHAPDSNVPPSNVQLWSLVMPGHSQTGSRHSD